MKDMQISKLKTSKPCSEKEKKKDLHKWETHHVHGLEDSMLLTCPLP